MTEDRIQQIEAVIAACEAKGIAWTNLLVFEEVGGQYQQVSRYLKQRRARACLAPPAPEEWALADDPQECPQDAPAAVEESEVCDGQGEACAASGAPETLPGEPETPPLSQRVSQLEALEQAAREADAELVRRNSERDIQQQLVQMAALALYQAKREAKRVAKDPRAVVRQAQAARGPSQQDAQARVAELYAALRVLVGAADAERIANDSHFAPPWFRS
jgi:hypothetical protein